MHSFQGDDVSVEQSRCICMAILYTCIVSQCVYTSYNCYFIFTCRYGEEEAWVYCAKELHVQVRENDCPDTFFTYRHKKISKN